MGRYAVALARAGHKIVLVEISTAELRHGQLYAKEEAVELEAMIEANALRIDVFIDVCEKDGFDVVLCQGPLYHLLERSEDMTKA